MGCAVACAVIDTIVGEKLVERAGRLGEAWMKRIRAIAKGCDQIHEVRGKGLLIGVEMGDHAKHLQKFGLREKMLINVCAGEVARLIPPLIIGEASLERFDGLFESYIQKHRSGDESKRPFSY